MSTTASGQTDTNSAQDPHRSPCVDAQCRKLRKFVLKHYCNEPESNSCEIKEPATPRDIEVQANYECQYSDEKGGEVCHQTKEPSPFIRKILMDEMKRLGLPTGAKKETYFEVWKSNKAGWTVAVATYSDENPDSGKGCQVVVITDKNSRAIRLREKPFNMPETVFDQMPQWHPIDIVDADGDGQVELVLRGDGYEDHWIEVVKIGHGSARTLFSGLGYSL